MGKVVDRNFRVIGIDALRVVDGSIFTVSPGCYNSPRLLFLCLDGKCLLLSECLSVAGLMTVRGVDNLLVCFGRYVGMKILRERMR